MGSLAGAAGAGFLGGTLLGPAVREGMAGFAHHVAPEAYPYDATDSGGSGGHGDGSGTFAADSS
jgi:hypothetical protein